MVDFLVLTAVQVELESMVGKMSEAHRINADEGFDAYSASINGNTCVIISLGKTGISNAAMTTAEALRKWRPRQVLTVGIAGGRPNRTHLGDVLVATQVLDVEPRKITSVGEHRNTRAFSSSDRLISAARAIKKTDWKRRITVKRPGRGEPQTLFGSIASSSAVIKREDYFQDLESAFSDILGVDMEGAGIGAAISRSTEKSEFLMIKGVADYTDDQKNDSWIEYAADVASAFAFTLIWSHASRGPKDSEATSTRERNGVTWTDYSTGDIGTSARFWRTVDTTSACFRASEYAQSLARVLADAQGEICFALIGHWGRGKTHLAKLVEERLPRYYDCVWFSGWKYRTRPELWVHLYETFRQKLYNEGWRIAIPRVFRGNLHRHGLVPILIAMLGIGIAAVPFSSFARLAIVILGIIGIFGLFRLATVYLKSRTRVQDVLDRYLEAAHHTQELGLQASLGLDLKSLILGWTTLPKTSRLSRFRGAAAYALALCVVLAGFFVGLRSPWDAMPPLLESFQIYPSPSALWVLLAIVLTVGVAVPLWLLFAARSKQRILLIVDDLDRMPALEALEVLESLKLFLEDEDIAARTQVMVLYEEDSLRHALQEKYGGLSKNKVSQIPTKESLSGEKVINRIIEENRQKLFIAHLRLPSLTITEQREFLSEFLEFVESDSPDEEESLPEEQTSSTSSGDDSGADPEVTEGGTTQEESDQGSPPSEVIELTVNEKRSLLKGVDIISSSKGSWASPGPRALQSYVFRYKLARELLLARGEQVNPSYLALALAERLASGVLARSFDGPSNAEVVNAVIEEVV